MPVKSWVLVVGVPVLAGVVASLWKLRTAKTDTYTRLQATVSLGLASLDRAAVDALVRVRSKLPITGFDRSMGAEDFEDSVRDYNQALKDKRRLKRRFRRLLGSSSLLIIGLASTLPSGVYLLLRGAAIENVPDDFLGPAWVLLVAGVALAAAGLAGQIYYEAKVARVAVTVDGTPKEHESDG